MAVRSTSSSASGSAASAVGPSLIPQGAHLGKPPIPLTRSFTLIGARNRAHLHLVSPSISKNHSAIICSDDGIIYVRDLSSRTHTVINGDALKESDLAHGDTLQVGTFKFKIANRPGRKTKAVEAPAAALEVEGAEFPIPFDQRTLLVGRRPTCDIPLVEESVSTIHAILFTVGTKRYIRDLGSRTGTFVNGSPIHQEELSFGDQIRVGDTTMRYEAHRGSGQHLDELEHLVGTAALDEVPPMGAPLPEFDHAAQEEIAPSHADAIPVESVGGSIPVESADDLIPLADEAPIPLTPEAPAAPVSNRSWAKPAPIPIDEADDIAVPIVRERTIEAELPPIDDVELDLLPAETAPVDEPEVAAPAAAEVAPAEAEGEPTETDAGLDFADEVDADAEIATVADEGPVDLATEELLASAPTPAPIAEPSLAEDDAADEVAAPAPLRPGDTAFNFPKAESEEAASEPIDLDFVPEAEHPAGLGGLDFSEGAEASAHTPAATGQGDLPELDLSGLTLDPPADAGSASDMGLDFDEDHASASPAATPLLNLGVTPPPGAASPTAPFGGFDLAEPAPARARNEKKPAARKEKAPKKEKKTWWSRKRKAQEEGASIGEAQADAEETTADEPLDAQIERALSGSFGGSGVTDQEAIDAVKPLTRDEKSVDSGAELDASLDLTDGEAEAIAHDSFAGLDFNAVATGSGLDFGGEFSSIDPPAHAEFVLPPSGPVAAPAAPAEVAPVADNNEWEVLDVIESTEPTVESALDIEDELAAEPVAPDAVAPLTGAVALDSDTTTVTDAQSLSDTAFARAVSDFSGSTLDPIVETPPAIETPASALAEPAADDDVIPASAAPAAAEAVSEEDLSFEELLNDELGATSPAETAEWADLADAPADRTAAPAELAAEADEPAAAETPVFDLQGWNPPIATPPAAPLPVAESISEPEPELTVRDEASVEVEPDLAFAPDEVAEVEEVETEDELQRTLAAEEEKSVAETRAEVSQRAATEEADEDFEALSDFGTGMPESADGELEAELDAPVPAHVPSDSVSPLPPEDPNHPMVTDLTSPTEDQVRTIAADPADAGHLNAAEALDFDLDLEEVPGLAGATAEDFAPAEPVEETLDEAFETAVGSDLGLAEEPSPSLASDAPAGAEEPLSFEATAGAEDLGLEFDEERTDETQDLAAEPAAVEPGPTSEPLPEPQLTASTEPAPAPPAEEELAGHLPSDPFFGLGRDTGSFLGGLPLQLPQSPVAPQAAAPAAAQRQQPQMAPRRPVGLPAFGSTPIGHVRRPGQPARPAAQAPVAPADVDDVDPIDFSEAEAPPRTKHPTPPPPARSVPPRVQGAGQQSPSMFDLGLGDVAGGAVEIPPLAGVSRAQAGTVTTAFDGLAMSSLGNTDVFSQLSPTNDPIFGAAGRKSAAEIDAEVDQALEEEDGEDHDGDGTGGDGTAVGEEVPPGGYNGDGSTDPSQQVPSAAQPGRADGKREKDRRPPGYTPPAQDPSRQPAPAQQAPPPKKRRWGVRFLLPMMLLCATGAAAAVYLLQPFIAPRSGTVVGTLEFERLKTLLPQDRTKFENDQRNLVRNTDVLNAAADLLRSQKENMPSGFLGGTDTADMRAVDAISSNLKVPEGSDQLVLTLDHSSNPKADKLRMRKLLDELYLRNRSASDKSGINQQSYEEVTTKLNEVKGKLISIKERIAQDRERAGAITKQGDLVDLEAETNKLDAAWSEARKRVHDIQADLEAAAGTDVADAAAGTPIASATTTSDDPQLAEMTRQFQALSKKLAAEKDAQNAQANRATTTINSALKKFQDEIDAAQKTINGNGELSAYLASAQAKQKQLADLYNIVSRQQETDRKFFSDFKKRLQERYEVKLKEAWNNDPELKQLQDSLSVNEHHRNAAVGSGLTVEVKKLDTEIARLNGQIQSRRDLLSTGFAYDAEVKDLQNFIDESLAQRETQRTANDLQMTELLASLKKDAPSVEKLPAEQQKLAQALAQRSAELDAARAQYAKAASVTATASGSQNSALEQHLTQMQAKLDARKRQIADAAAQNLTQKQKQARQDRLERRKAELAEAQTAEKRAYEAQKAKRVELSVMQSEVSIAEVAGRQLDEDIKTQQRLEDDQSKLIEEATQSKTALAKLITPTPVTDSNVTVTMDEDTRPLLASIGFVIVVVFFSVVMFVVSHSPHDHAGAIPFAASADAESQTPEPDPAFEMPTDQQLAEFESQPAPPTLRRSKTGRGLDAGSPGDEHPLPI